MQVDNCNIHVCGLECGFSVVPENVVFVSCEANPNINSSAPAAVSSMATIDVSAFADVISVSYVSSVTSCAASLVTASSTTILVCRLHFLCFFASLVFSLTFLTNFLIFYALLVVTGMIFPFDFICMIARVVPGLRIGPRCSRTTGRKRRSNPG